LAETTQQLAVKREIASLLSAAGSNARAAADKLPTELELNAVAQSLLGKSDTANAEAANLETTRQEQTKVAQATEVAFAAAQQAAADMAARAAGPRETAAKLKAQAQEVSDQHRVASRAWRDADDRLTELWSQSFFAHRLKHLTPEQMGWSVMQATGVLEDTRAAGLAEVDKTLPLDPQNPHDPQRLAERERQLETFVHDKTKGHVAAFVKLFGHAGGQPQADFFATVDQALFFANGGAVLSWLNPSGNNLTSRLNQLPDATAIAEELYLSVLTRRPSAEETAEVSQYLAARPDDKPGALKEVAWALLTSAEFRFGH
jgi:hypothetical protein